MLPLDVAGGDGVDGYILSSSTAAVVVRDELDVVANTNGSSYGQGRILSNARVPASIWASMVKLPPTGA
jgi:hypothetical protein